jgi:hypothetical protein
MVSLRPAALEGIFHLFSTEAQKLGSFSQVEAQKLGSFILGSFIEDLE